MAKQIKPLYVHYFDNQAATLYNLTKEQFDKLMEEDNGIDVADKFQVPFDDWSAGYIPSEVAKLAEIYGFEVGTE